MGMRGKTMRAFKDELNWCAGEIEKALDYFLPGVQSRQGVVAQAMRYSTLGGGKRVRGVLVMKFCQACGGDPRQGLPFACALEMIHASSLIHDDLPCMDDDCLRRGKPSCHVAFGEANALLAGDALINLAFDVLSSEESVKAVGAENALKAVNLLSRKVGVDGMIGGQVVDLESEGKSIDEDTLEYLHRLKTCALIQAAAALGCIAAGASKEKLQLALHYGDALGLAFQIVDDILDVTGDVAQLGKPIGSDSEQEKTTYVTLKGLSGAKADAAQCTQRAREVLDALGLEEGFLYEFTDMLLNRTK